MTKLVDPENPVLITKEVCTHLRCSPATVARLREGGLLRGFRLAGEYRFYWKDVRDFVRKQMANTTRRKNAPGGGRKKKL